MRSRPTGKKDGHLHTLLLAYRSQAIAQLLRSRSFQIVPIQIVGSIIASCTRGISRRQWHLDLDLDMDMDFVGGSEYTTTVMRGAAWHSARGSLLRTNARGYSSYSYSYSYSYLYDCDYE